MKSTTLIFTAFFVTASLAFSAQEIKIDVVNIGGGLTVSDGSGGIDIDRVEKDLILKETGSGGVHYSNIKGRVIK